MSRPRIRRLLPRWAIVVGPLFIVALVLARTGRDSSPTRSGPAVESLQFLPASGWRQETTGMHPSRPLAVSATVASVKLRDPAGSLPQRTLEHLPADGIVITATLFVPLHSRGATFTERSLPLSLDDADVRSGWEGQPATNVPEYVLWQRVNGYDLDVRVYFGTQNPSGELETKARTELARLAVPFRGSSRR